MVDIFNERTYITNILKSGFNPEKWKRDADIYIRFFKEEGVYKRREVREKLIEKCKRYVPDFDMENTYYSKSIDALMKKSWDKFKPLRCLDNIILNRQIIDYFLTLPVKKEERNFLFGLYVWIQIMRQYMTYFPERPRLSIDNEQKKFKEWNNIKQSTNLLNLEIRLDDYIAGDSNARGKVDRRGYKHYSYYIYPDFINDNPELFFVEEQKTRTMRQIIPKEEQIEMTYDDMMSAGLFLDKQDFGTFVCQNCGKETIYNSKTPQSQRSQKYCRDCRKSEINTAVKKIQHKTRAAERESRACTQCGAIYEILKTSKRELCDACYKDYRREQARLGMQKNREKPC